MRHSRRLIFQLSEVSVPRRLFEGVLDRIGRRIAGAKPLRAQPVEPEARANSLCTALTP